MALFNEDGCSLAKRSPRMPPFLLISISLVVICAFASLTTADTTEAAMAREQAAGQHSQSDSETPAATQENQHPRTVQELFSRLQRSGSGRGAGNGLLPSTNSGSGEPKTCVIEVQEIRRIPGRCIKLMGGMNACKSEEYLDPMSQECE